MEGDSSRMAHWSIVENLGLIVPKEDPVPKYITSFFPQVFEDDPAPMQSSFYKSF